MMFGVYCGDFTEERTVLLASVPEESVMGTTLRTLWVLADQQDPAPEAHWVLTIGTYGEGPFKAIRAIPFSGGFSGTPQRVDLTPEIPVGRGQLMALKATPTANNATPLTGLSVIPEYAMTGARAR